MSIDGRVGRLLADPASWTKEAFARDAGGNPVPETSAVACSFCLNGAVRMAYPMEDWADAFDALAKAIAEKTHDQMMGVVGFNDRFFTTHEDVLTVLEKAGI